MTDSPFDKKIPQLPQLIASFRGDEQFVLSRDAITYRIAYADLIASFIASSGVNRPPVTTDFSQTTNDTGTVLSGNVLAGATDADSDPIVLGKVNYAGTDIPYGTATAVTYGVFYWLPDGTWSYTLGKTARALTTGDIEHEVFTVVAQDPRGGLSTKHLTITIIGTNSSPIVSYVNGGTPVNQALSGNLLYRLAFDFETAVTISSYTVEGISGTHTAGTPTTIAGVGTIVIASNGDYTFTPSGGFVGPVPLITYVVTDGVNDVDGYLTLAADPSIAGSQPIVLFTDIPSGPVDDGSGDNTGGAYMHLHGCRFGDAADLGTTTKVYIDEQEVGAYMLLDTDPYAKPGFGRQRIAVRVGALSGVDLGKPQHIKVVVGGQDSNQDCVFTPNPGRIFYVSKLGNDSTGVIGDILHPFRLLQTADRLGGVYPLLRAGDQVIVRGDGGADWTDTGYTTAWLRFRDVAQQGSNPTGDVGTGWIWFMGYPGEDVKYATAAGTKGGFQGPGQDVTGTTGDFVGFSNFRIRVGGGATRDAGPVNMQYNAQRCRVVGCELGPWVAGSSPVLNCAGVSGEGNFFEILGCHIHSIEGTAALQNHAVYPGTNSYGWTIAYNWMHDIPGGSILSFNDSDGGTGVFETPFGTWTGFTNIRIHHNWLENAAKYILSFNDVGAQQGELEFQFTNNFCKGSGLPPFHFGTTNTTVDGVVAFNTVYDCNTTVTGGNAMVRNDGWVHTPGRSIKFYDNIFAFGPGTATGTAWLNDTTGFSDGITWSRNLYWVNGDTTAPSPSMDALAVIGDPKFVDPTGGDFSLQVTSPAINSGTQALPTGVLVADDYTCQLTRQVGGAPEIGCFEYAQPTPYILTPPSSSGGPQVTVSTGVTFGTWGNAPSSQSRQFRVGSTAVGSANTGTGTFSRTSVAGDERQHLYCDFAVSNGAGTVNYTVDCGIVAVGSGAPVNTGLPVVTGDLASGAVSSLSDGTWSGDTSPGFAYDWVRGSTVIAGETANTYTKTDADIGFMLTGRVYALDPVNGSRLASSVAVGPITAAPADPVIAQAAVTHALVASSNVNFAFGSDVEAGSLALVFMGEWDQAPYNGHYSDSQGHNTSDFTRTTAVNHTAGNPWIGWGYYRLSTPGPYTLTINMDSGAGGAAVALNINGLDPSAVVDIPSDAAQATASTSIALSGSVANTKAKDLVLIGVSVAGTAHTITPDTGWDLVDQVVGTFQSVHVFKRKETTIETFNFTATLDSAANWVAQSFVVKGS